MTKQEPTFEEAVTLYWQDMVNMAQHIIKRQPEDAEDAVQQAMLTLSRAQHTYDPTKGASIKTWMITAVRSRALDYLRDSLGRRDLINNSIPTGRQSDGSTGRRNRAPTLEEIDYGAASSSIEQYRPGNEQVDLRLDIEKAFLSLTEEERLIADKIFIQGYPLDDVAKTYNTSRGAFWRDKFNPLRQKLRTLLSEHAPHKEVTTPAIDSKTA